MVKVIYDRECCRVTVRGHAGSGKKGQDLVCAGVSALVLTLATNVSELAAADQVRRPVVSLRQGNTCIGCVALGKMKPVVTLIFDTVCTGFATLQQLYPKNIAYIVTGI